FRLSGGLDVSALESALNHVVARHEVLRTTFEERDGEVVQIIHAHRKHELPLVDLGDDRDPDETVLSLAAAEAERAFDLEKGPLLRASLLRLAPDEHVLLLTLHHIVIDDWSCGILMRELTEGYKAFVDGRMPSLPALPIQYGDYAVWQRQL